MLLWHFWWKPGITGMFVATWDEVCDHIGYRGTIAQDHGCLEWGDLEVMPMDPISVERVTERLGKTWAGFNPLELLDEAP